MKTSISHLEAVSKKLGLLADKLQEATQYPRRNTAEMWTAIGALRSAGSSVWNAAMSLQYHEDRHGTEEE